MLEQQRDYVLRTVEERGVRLIRLWFTDVLGNLKSFAISPAELENALEDGMTFDGSSIDGFSRIQESDVLAIPDAEHVRGAAVGRPQGAPRPGCSATSTTSTARRSRATRARCCAATCEAAHEQRLHVLRRARHRVLLLRPAREGAGAGAARRGRLLRPHHHRRRRLAAQADHPHARDDEHPGGVQLPRGRAEPARDRPAPHRRADDGRQHHDLPTRGEGGRRQPGRARHVHAQAARGRAGQRHARAPVAVRRRRERVLLAGRRLQPVAGRQAVHGRSAAPRRRDHRDHQPDRQQLQAAGARVRGAGAHQLGAQQPQRADPRADRQARQSQRNTASSTARPIRRATRTWRSP